jgi:hypothetical protein
LGGKKALENQLDDLFVAEDKTSGRHQVDITGLIGQYAHGNEPSHHMAYLYNFVNKPAKTQEKVRQILTELYTNTPDGISGNEDCGQMSAWYIFSALGFYPVTPGSNQYIIGTPLFEKATLNLENGKIFTIQANQLSAKNKYIKAVTLNGKDHAYSYIQHDAITQGGLLVFEMTDQPSTWGTQDAFIPQTKIEEHLIVPAPFIAKGKTAFKGNTAVTLSSVDKNATIYFSLGSEFQKYIRPFLISEKATLVVYAQKGSIKSAVITTDFYKIDPNLKIALKTAYANQYNAGGDNALIDGVVGAEDFRTGTWQGYFDTDLIAVVDLGSKKNIKEVSIGFLQDQRSWIFYPTAVSCLVSNDGINFQAYPNGSEIIKPSIQTEAITLKRVQFKGAGSFRYVKVIAKKLGVLPTWHLGYKHDGRSWLFVDEIQIQ